MELKLNIIIYLTLTTIALCLEKVTYINIERALALYVNEAYVYKHNFNFTALRYGRKSLVYYVNLDFEAKVWFGNNFTVDFYFYEFLTNRYKRSFVEMHFKFCDLIHKDLFFGAAMKQGKLDGPCPYAPGAYSLSNMTVLPEAIPRGFPFTKGRIYANMTLSKKKEVVFSGCANMEIKTIKIKDRKKNDKL